MKKHGMTRLSIAGLSLLLTAGLQAEEKPLTLQDYTGWGYADDSSPDEGMSSPPFNLAFGVTEGKHSVEVAEWSYPPLPPAPARRQAGE